MKCGARLYLAAMALGNPLLWPLAFGVAPPTASAIFAAVPPSKSLVLGGVVVEEENSAAKSFPQVYCADRPRNARLQPEMLERRRPSAEVAMQQGYYELIYAELFLDALTVMSGNLTSAAPVPVSN